MTTGSPTWSRIPLSEIDRVEIPRRTGIERLFMANDAIGGVGEIFTRRRWPGAGVRQAGAAPRTSNSAAAASPAATMAGTTSLNTASLRTRGISRGRRGASGLTTPDKDG